MRARCLERAPQAGARKDADFRLVALSLAYVEREKRKIAAVLDREVATGSEVVDQVSLYAAEPVDAHSARFNVKEKKMLLAAASFPARMSHGWLGLELQRS